METIDKPETANTDEQTSGLPAEINGSAEESKAVVTAGEKAVSPVKKEKPVKAKKEKRDRYEHAPERRFPLVWSVVLLAFSYLLCAASLVFSLIRAGQAEGQIIGAALALLAGFAIAGFYSMLRLRDHMTSVRKALLVCVLLTVAIAPMPFTMSVNIGFIPLTLMVLLLALLVNERIAIVASVPVAVAAAVIAGALGEAESAPAAIMLASLASGVAAVLALNIRKTRSSTVIAAGAAGAAAVFAFSAVMLAGGEIFGEYWMTLLWLLGSCIVSGILAIGLMPVFETAFDVASDARLNELLNNNNPLLKRLMTEASGTYQHSLTVASLAEAAAETVGANALLCRVCACYHDVGKLASPRSFKENQRTDRNLHDELDPFESAKIILSHVKDGVDLLKKNKFPRDVIDIVAEHHGDSVMVYFYDKAKRMAGEGETVDINAFRYPSHKPTTKESAILMLADCCEAAVRSMNNPTMKDIANKVREVVTHKWDRRSSMLWDSPLTFVDIKRIEVSFLRTFAALYHERVEYPDLEEIDVR